MVEWNHQVNGPKLRPTPGDGKGQRVWRAVVHGVAMSWT